MLEIQALNDKIMIEPGDGSSENRYKPVLQSDKYI